jgi:hypothetical protein
MQNCLILLQHPLTNFKINKLLLDHGYMKIVGRDFKRTCHAGNDCLRKDNRYLSGDPLQCFRSSDIEEADAVCIRSQSPIWISPK